MRGRIFHLEDGIDYARELHEKLSELGHRVVFHALTVAEALALIPHALVEHGVSLAILDRDLPDGSGIHVAEAIRSAGLTIPIIANSGYETDFGDYNVTKLQSAELLRTVSAALGVSSHEALPSA